MEARVTKDENFVLIRFSREEIEILARMVQCPIWKFEDKHTNKFRENLFDAVQNVSDDHPAVSNLIFNDEIPF